MPIDDARSGALNRCAPGTLHAQPDFSFAATAVIGCVSVPCPMATPLPALGAPSAPPWPVAGGLGAEVPARAMPAPLPAAGRTAVPRLPT
jgi:hypothetical protein